MSKQRHRRHSQGGTTPETTPQTGSGVAQFSVSDVAQFSMSLDMWFEWVANKHEKMPAIKDPDVIKYMMNSIIERQEVHWHWLFTE
jgi:hypothetical protein